MKLSLSLTFLLFLNVIWAEQAHRKVFPKNAKNFHERRDKLPHETLHEKRDEDVSKRLSILPFPTPYYPYYPQKQFQCEMCCNGTKFNGLYPYTSSCCGNKIYDSNTAICCGSNAIPFKPTTTNYGGNYQWQCCGDNSLYNTTSQLCCGNQTFPKMSFQQCCGNEVYDASKNICCGDTSVAIPTTYNAWSCCGSSVYDVTVQQCKDNTLTDKQPGIEPYDCGSNTIDFKTQICCNGTAITRKNYTLCCGNQGFQANEQMCCGGAIFPDDQSGTQDCCGSQQIKITSQTCCNNVIVDTPTGTDCSSFSCCGSELYNPTSQTSVCCNDNLNQIQTTTSNSSSKIAAGSFFPYPSYNYQCCGSQTYNPLTQTCCGQTTVVDSGPSALCCGNASYDASQNTCCNNVLYAVGGVPQNICCCPNGGCNNYPIFPIYY